MIIIMMALPDLLAEESPQRKPLTELNGQSWAPKSSRKPVDAPSQIEQAGAGPEPATPHWKGFAGRKSRVSFSEGPRVCASKPSGDSQHFVTM